MGSLKRSPLSHVAALAALAALAVVAGLALAGSSARAQGADTASAASSATTPPKPAAVVDSFLPPVTPKRALWHSFILPGWGQSELGSHRAAAGMLAVEAISFIMIRESGADDREARRTENDSVVVSYVGSDGSTLSTPQVQAGRFGTADVLARRSHIEDWAALLIANHLFSGADAYVEASLWGIKAQLGVSATPSGRGATLSAAFHWW